MHAHLCQNVKSADISAFLSCSQCISNLQRDDGNASGNIIIVAILFLFFGALDWGLTARGIESLPHCPHFTQTYSILHPPFLTLYTL